jgi:hypothetical protein
MPKEKVTMSVDDAVLELIRIRAVKEKRSLSSIAEELFCEYLKRPVKPKN